MPRKSKEEILQAVHQQALREFDKIQEAVKDQRDECLEDRRFYSIAGAQWEGPLEEQFANKPRFEVNKVHLSVIRIINEYRNNRITVDFVGDSDDTSDLADSCDALYRQCEKDSCAEEAYDNAFEEAVGGGIGAWRLRSVYVDEEDPESDEQKIVIEPIYDADSTVFFGLEAKRQDKSDAKKCFVLTSMTREEFIDEYDEDPSTWPKVVGEYQFDWVTIDVVYVAEYYKVVNVRKVIEVWEGLDGTEKRYTEEELDEEGVREKLHVTGWRKVREKKVSQQKVHKYIMCGNCVLEDCGIIAGKYIPIVPVYGKRWFVDNIERAMGHVRLSKDAQRLKNVQLSKLGEISAYSSVRKPILTPEQIAGHQIMWQEDNVKNYPYLLINPTVDQNGNEIPTGPVSYLEPPNIPQALGALLQITEEDMQDLLGNQQNGEVIEGNVSTETAQLVQNRLDMQTFIYMSNMAKSIKRSGEIFLHMASDVYVEKDRSLTGLTNQGEKQKINLYEPTINDEGKTVYKNDFSKAKKMGVYAEVGPASSTKKAATVRSLTNLLKFAQDPETQQVITSMIMMNTEGEGMSDVRKFFRKKLVMAGVVTPTEEEKIEMSEALQNQEPTPNDQYLLAAAEAERARGLEAQADVVLKQAKADESRAKTVETMSKVENEEARIAMEAVEKLGPRINPIRGSDRLEG